MTENRIVGRRSAAAAAFALLALAPAGLGGCEPSPEPEAQRGEMAPAAPAQGAGPGAATEPVSLQQQEVRIGITDSALNVSPNTVSPGPAVIYVTNGAGVPYDVSFEGPGLDSEAEDLQPGETRSLTTTLQVGTYEIEVSAERGPELERKVLLTVRP